MRTKNVYVGNQRVVSVLNPNEQTRYEYYYHTDHLGSTTYLTDRDGKLKEHIEYTPWGEGWIEQEQGFPTDYLPYKFTGKELDSTGLYYFGARYYDPRISMWLSADPALGRYLQAGGKDTSESVFNSKNLGLYTYCHQNPLIFMDPDGNNPISALVVGPLVGFSTYLLDKQAGQSENAARLSGIGAGLGAATIAALDFTEISTATLATAALTTGVFSATGNVIGQSIDIKQGLKNNIDFGDMAITGIIGATSAVGLTAAEIYFSNNLLLKGLSAIVASAIFAEAGVAIDTGLNANARMFKHIFSDMIIKMPPSKLTEPVIDTKPLGTQE